LKVNKEENEEEKQESKVKEVKYLRPEIKIGQGKYGPVELIIYKGNLHALKQIPKTSIDKHKRMEHMKNEKSLLNALKVAGKTPNFIVDLVETFVDVDSVNYVFEYLPGQDLFWLIQNEMNLFLGKQKGPAKQWVKFYASEILVALENLHSQNIIYRDLKPENVMIDKDGHIKLIDFGFAKRLTP